MVEEWELIILTRPASYEDYAVVHITPKDYHRMCYEEVLYGDGWDELGKKQRNAWYAEMNKRVWTHHGHLPGDFRFIMISRLLSEGWELFPNNVWTFRRRYRDGADL